MKFNWWIEINSQAGKRFRSTRAFRGTEEQARAFAENQKRRLLDKGHVNVVASLHRIESMTYMGKI